MPSTNNAIAHFTNDTINWPCHRPHHQSHHQPLSTTLAIEHVIDHVINPTTPLSTNPINGQRHQAPRLLRYWWRSLNTQQRWFYNTRTINDNTDNAINNTHYLQNQWQCWSILLTIHYASYSSIALPIHQSTYSSIYLFTELAISIHKR